MDKDKNVWTISSLLNWTVDYFKRKGIESARLDAEVLLAAVLHRERIYLYVHFDEPMEAQELAKFRTYVAQRAKKIPVAYILGEREFMGLRFKVTPDTLIPRPDTEILVEAVNARIDKAKSLQLLDIGTGSGAIIISLLHLLNTAMGYAVDISEAALRVAEENARSLGVAERWQGMTGDLFTPVGGSHFDVIVSNPPYIPVGDIASLSSDVKDYEPLSALTDNGDGLSFYRRLMSEGQQYLNAGGFMAVEIGINQAEAVTELAKQYGWKNIEVIKDYAGIDRVVVAWKQD